MIGKLDRRRHGVVANPVLDSESFAHAKIILGVGGEAPAPEVRAGISKLHAGIVGKSQEKIREVVSRSFKRKAIRAFLGGYKSREGELPARNGIRIVVELDAANFSAESHGVFCVDPGETVIETQRLIAHQRGDRIVQARKIRKLDQRKTVIDREWWLYR